MPNSDNEQQVANVSDDIAQLQHTISEINQSKNTIVTEIKGYITVWLKKWLLILFGGFSVLTTIALIQIYLQVIDKTQEYMIDSITKKFSEPTIKKTLTDVAQNQAQHIIQDRLKPSIRDATALIDKRTGEFEATLNKFTSKYDSESDVLADEVKILKQRNYILELGDGAIATGVAKNYDKLFEIFNDSVNNREKMLVIATIKRIKSHFSRMSSMGNTKISYIGDDTKVQFVDKNIPTEILVNEFHEMQNWKHRARALQILKFRVENGVPDCLLSAMNDEYLEVRKLAMDSFESITGYNSNDVFGEPVRTKLWWDKNKVEVSKILKKQHTIENAQNGIKAKNVPRQWEITDDTLIPMMKF